jgi:hypothetical protein
MATDFFSTTLTEAVLSAGNKKPDVLLFGTVAE